MALPKKLKYFNVYVNGNSFVGEVESFTPPKLTRKFENYRGAGMPASVPIDMGYEDDALNIEWTIGGLAHEVLKQHGGSLNGVTLRFVGAYQKEDSEDFVKVEIIVNGRHKEHDRGELKLGESNSTKITTQCTYYKEIVDNEEITEIDVINMIDKVNGEDRLSKARNAIGL